MRFRARISKESILVLQGVISQLHRIGDIAVIFLSAECVRLAVVSESVDNPRCYSELQANVLFEDYRIESQISNTILFEIGIENLSRALSSGKNAANCLIKLVKRGVRPCLSFETQSLEALNLNVTHDIPIRLLPSTDIVYYNPPEVPPPTVSLELPRNKLLRTIIDRMAKFAKYVHITACQMGSLQFQVDHASTIIKTFYGGLVPRYEGNLRVETDANNTANIQLEIKKLSIVLNQVALQWDGGFICKYE